MEETIVQETPVKRQWAKALSDALRAARDAGNRMVPEDLPLVGGAKLGDMFLGQAPEGAERLAYGERMTSGRGQTLQIRPETLDLATLIPIPGGGQTGMAARAGGKVDAAIGALRAPKVKQTVENAQRIAYPGIYKRPDEIAREASEMVAPENPMLKQLFGVTRDDLYQISKGRQGNINPVLPGAAAKPKGSAAAEGVMNKRNENRILNTLGEAEQHPELYKGMVGWYVMDPAFQRLKALVGEDEAIKRYSQFNALSGMASPGSDVLTEFNRGSAANWLANEGRFDDFVKYAGMPADARYGQFPSDMMGIMGHPYHKTAQAQPMQKFLAKGEVDMKSPKVPMYIEASGVPETGFQTAMPVGDAHWSRAVGLGDTRTNQAYGASVSTPEMSQLGPWWRDRIAAKMGLESVPAQALAWGTFAKQTGVDTPVGAPKLELFAQQIEKAAKRMGVTPETARDLILTGKAHAGLVGQNGDMKKMVADEGRRALVSALRNKSQKKEEDE
jgi:hypothetical protein